MSLAFVKMEEHESFLKKSLHFIFICDICVYTRCALDQKESMKDIINTILFGKYLIISRLGAGSFGTVYLSKHQILETYRAIKRIPKLNNSTVSLLSEAKLLKSLNHPGIPKIYDIYEDNDYFYLIEEYINGESLDEFLLHQSHISQNMFIDWCLQLCKIFQYLHTFQPSPILYLDLKPEHVIVCGMKIKLIDFNVSNYLSNLGNIYNLFGNKDFSAPELYSGTAPNLLSDIYSIGKIMQYLSLHVDTSISPKFHNIIKKAMNTEISGRFETVDQLISAINQEKFLSGQSSSRIKIAILGSHTGCGSTHIAISLVSSLNYMGYSAIYYEKNETDNLRQMIPYIDFMQEDNGMLCYRFFKGYPNYGPGIQMPAPTESISVYDCGGSIKTNDIDFDYVLYICSNSPWHRHELYQNIENIPAMRKNLKIICNLGQASTMRKLSKHFSSPSYHYAFDKDVFCITKEKIDFVSKLLSIKRRNRLFFHSKHNKLFHQRKS